MNTIDYLADEIYKRYGSIKRARNCFLYTAKSVRLTDMYQENGRAILGWGGDSVFTMLKNVLSKGITGSYKTDFSYRLEKAVSALFNSNRKIFLFNNKKSAILAGVKFNPEDTAFWKPWISTSQDWSNVKSLVFDCPLPWASPLYILALKYENQEEYDSLIFNDEKIELVKLASPMEAAYTRSIYNMIKALQERSEKDWFVYDKVLTKYWTRKGPYLITKIPEEKYNEFVLHCLDLGIIINPVYNQESIIPYGADLGVFNSLKNNPFIF